MFHFCIAFFMIRCIFREHGCLHGYDRFLPFPDGKDVVNPFDLFRITAFVNDMCFQLSAETKEVISDSFLNSSNPWLQNWPQGMSNFHKLQQSPGIKFVLNTNLYKISFLFFFFLHSKPVASVRKTLLLLMLLILFRTRKASLVLWRRNSEKTQIHLEQKVQFKLWCCYCFWNTDNFIFYLQVGLNPQNVCLVFFFFNCRHNSLN